MARGAISRKSQHGSQLLRCWRRLRHDGPGSKQADSGSTKRNPHYRNVHPPDSPSFGCLPGSMERRPIHVRADRRTSQTSEGISETPEAPVSRKEQDAMSDIKTHDD